MKHSFPQRFLLSCFVLLLFTQFVIAQKKPARVKPKINTSTIKEKEIVPTILSAPEPQKNVSKGIVIDERLSVLRSEPSLYALPVQRMRTGRDVMIINKKDADGVTFYRVNALPNNTGWVQADAIVTKGRRGDDERLAKLVNATNGFEQIELASIFLEVFTESNLRPPILLLFGDLIEDQARKLSIEATRKLTRREMAATEAPLHSFYLNYSGLDRYQKMGVMFFFNANTKFLHYNGKTWQEIVKKFPKSSEAEEAKSRLESLKQKLEITEEVKAKKK